MKQRDVDKICAATDNTQPSYSNPKISLVEVTLYEHNPFVQKHL